jgi:uncharacterized protein (TIGR04141 family)
MPPATSSHELNAIAGATFYRLIASHPKAAGRTAADIFIDGSPDRLFIDSLEEGHDTLYLYGETAEGEAPSFAAFLARFQRFSPPKTRKYGYVVIVHHPEAPSCWYALAFGQGRFLLKGELIDVEAHREVARRETIPKEPGRAAKIRQARTKQPGINSTITTEVRSSRPGPLADLDIDLQTTILDEVFGEPHDKENFGTGLAGGSGLTIRKRLRLTDVPAMATLFETSYQNAMAEGGALPGVRTVKSVDLIEQLDEALLKVLQTGEGGEIGFSPPYFATTLDAVPELYLSHLGRIESQPDDLTIDDYRNIVRRAHSIDELDIAYLKRATVAIGADRKPQFTIYQCLPATVELDGIHYVHEDRSWYIVPATIAAANNDEVDRIALGDNLLSAPSKRLTEVQYNKDQDKGNILSLDAKSRKPFEGEKPIEICDLLTFVDERLTFIHVKRDFSSSTLSHLFNQGRVSALTMQDGIPRAAFLRHIQECMKTRGGKQPAWRERLKTFLGPKFLTSNLRITYAILGDWKGKTASQRLPFFSKTMLVKAARELRGRGFDVALCRLQMSGPTRKKGP